MQKCPTEPSSYSIRLQVRLIIVVVSMKEQGEKHRQPLERSGVQKAICEEAQERPRKFEDGKKLRKKNSMGFFAYNVIVVKAEYDPDEHCWMYTLKDHKSEPMSGTYAETELGP